ncbi:phage head-tail connector protein [Clostridium sp. Marseille-Q2269]|uniref:phage head-tail connector protein n=1 Tax=Clostridium sp. Marseille-Q2269 TaxID=2942205 RepID=UPI002072CBC7|nr:phage head-tail connector protein [Clostridium sp. Marseille-Q2269]
MSVENFKATLWEGALLANFHSVSVADAVSTKPTKIQGTKVIFNRVGAGAIKDYTGTVSWDEINTTPIEMVFDKKKYFAFSLDDCDKVQLVADVMGATTAEHAAVLAETYDKDFYATLAAGGKAANKIGSASSKKDISSMNVYDYIVDLGTILSKNKVPKSDRYVTVDAEILGLLSKDRRFTPNPTVLQNGVVEGQTINGMKVVCTEEKILQSLKLRPGISNFSDELLKDLISDSYNDVSEFTNLNECDKMPLGCISIVKDLVIIKVNKLGSEGLSSESYSGASQSYIEDIPKDIKRKLRRYRKIPR